VAVERGALLKPRLSTLAVAPAAAARDLPGLSIACNGGVIERADWGAVVPRDGGTYVIIASAPGKKPWRGRVSLAASADHQTVAVPVLDPGEAVPAPAATATSATVAPAPAPMATAALPAPAPAAKGPPPNAGVLVGRPASDAVPAQPRTSALRRTGIALIGAGAAALAVSSFYGLRAMNQNNQSSRDGCVGDVCNPTGKSARLAALSSGRTSTIFGIAGVAAAASGIAAFIWGGRSSAGTAVGARARHVAWSVDPALDHVLLSVVFTGGVTP
jgi:hypothetical protein